MDRKNINKLFEILEHDYDATIDTELWFDSKYQLLVAIMLSAQSTDKQVNKITKELFRQLKKPQDAVRLGFDGVNKLIASVNYHNSKARHIVEMSETLIGEFGGEVPGTMDELLRLSGVGRKTANLVLSIAYKQDAIAVDTHVFRVANRLGLTRAKNPVESEMQLKSAIPAGKQRLVNTLLIQHGRAVCNARNPKCEVCKFKGFCEFYKNKKG